MAKKKEKKKRHQKKLYHKDDSKTEFKSRKIKLNESSQLKNNAIKLLLNKNLKVNTKLKIKAFEKMNINLKKVEIDNITGETINGLAKYLLDENDSIRSQFIKAVKNFFDKLQENDKLLTPYIQILLIYIKCGLTHIDQRIKRDSRKLLEYLIPLMDSNLRNNLVHLINSRFKNSNEKISPVDLNLIRLILKYVSKNENELDSETRDIPNFQWSTTNCVFLHKPIENFNKFKFNFSFSAINKEESEENDLDALTYLNSLLH